MGKIIAPSHDKFFELKNHLSIFSLLPPLKVSTKKERKGVEQMMQSLLCTIPSSTIDYKKRHLASENSILDYLVISLIQIQNLHNKTFS